MHVYCTGEGSPTIVLDAGMGNYSLIWAKVQPELSKTTRVCCMTAPEWAGALRSLVRATLTPLSVNYILYCSNAVLVAPLS